MATRIIEYSADGKFIRSVYPAPAIVEQAAITATATSAQSSAFNAATNLVCIDSDEKVHFKFGENPTATTNSQVCPAGQSREVEIVRGAALKVAVRIP